MEQQLTTLDRKDPRSIDMKHFTKFFRRSMMTGMISEIVSYGFMLICGYLLSHLLEIAMAGQWEKIGSTAVWTVAVLTVSAVPKYGLGVHKSCVKHIDTEDFREYLYRCVLDRTVTVSDRGEMEVRMTSDVKAIAKYYQDTCPKAVSGIAVMLCSVVLLSFADWRIGLIFFALNFTQLIPIVVYEKWARQIYQKTRSDEESYSNWMIEGHGGIRTIKAYGAERWYMKRFFQFNRAIIDSGKRAEKTGTLENIVYQAIDSLLNYGSYLIVGFFVLYGGLDMSKAPLLILLGEYLFSTIRSVYDWRMEQFDCQEACKRLRLEEKMTDGSAQAFLSLENVTKSYGDKKVLRGISCEVKRGEHILLRGDNGSGKSTLLRLILGLEDADGGRITRGFAENSYAVSLQEEPEANISGSEILNAVRSAGCTNEKKLEQHLEVFRLGDLLDKPLSQLSPGERKKFYLALALAHKGELLILDEPTNHIDRESIEYLIGELCSCERTLIVCTHTSSLLLPWSRTIQIKEGLCHGS